MNYFKSSLPPKSRHALICLLLVASPFALADTTQESDVTKNKQEVSKKAKADKSKAVLSDMTVTEKIAAPTAKEKYKIPTTTESVTREQIDNSVNVMNVEDTIKYLPNVLVRKRYIGDTNAPVGMRTSGTSASARNLIYADGILLSSLLGNNNSNTGSPRWNTVSPSEIERVDVMYGPFSAAYPGNSVGGVIDIKTRMPEKFEAGAGVQSTWQDFNMYGSKGTYDSQQYSANVGDRYKDFSFRFDVNHLDSHSQPITYTAPLTSSGVVGGLGTKVSGAVNSANPTNAPMLVLGSGNLNHTVQDNFKWKLAYDITPTIKASYTLGMWNNDANAGFNSFLRDAAGNPVMSGLVNIGGKQYNLSAANSPSFAGNKVDQTTWSHGMNIKSNTGGKFDWELVGSIVELGTDKVRAPTVDPTKVNGAGRTTSLTGSNWHTADAKGIWRPGVDLLGKHEVSFGFHHDLYELVNPVNTTANWLSGGSTGVYSNSVGKTQTEGYWVQDAWDFHKAWNLTLGGRLENWNAYDGVNQSLSGTKLMTLNQSDRTAVNFSPKGKLTWSPLERVKVGAAVGQAYRYPTAAELFQTSTSGAGAGATLINGNPNLKPENAVSTELSTEYFLDNGKLRLSLFQEQVKNAIFSQNTLLSTGAISSIVNNVGQTDTYGVELAGLVNDIGISGLDLSANGTWADSRISNNDASDAATAAQTPAQKAAALLSNPNALAPTNGKIQPRVPQWRANTTLTYRPTAKLSTSVGLRYSSAQFGNLNNSDTNHNTYVGVSSYFVVDTRVRYQVTKELTASAGIDNINNDQYFIYHPFPQRTYMAELKYNY